MQDILNVSSVHLNGEPKLKIGIRGREFLLQLTDSNIIEIVNPNTGQLLPLSVSELLTTVKYVKFIEPSTDITGGEIAVFDANKNITFSNITENDIKSIITGLKLKANSANTLAGYGIGDAYTRAETVNLIRDKADAASSLVGYGIMDAYTKDEITELLLGKASKSTTLSGYGIIDAYTRNEINGLFASNSDTLNTKADKSTTLAGYGITDAYTRTQVDAKLVGALQYKGSKNTFAGLLAEVTNGTITPMVGWVYNIVEAGGTDCNGTLILKGANVAYNGTGWDSLGGSIDLTEYIKSSEINPQINTITGNITALTNVVNTKVDASNSLSGYGITDAYTKTEVDISISIKADASTTLSGYGITDAYTKTEVDADKASKATTLSGYGITDAYTKTETISLIPKVNISTSAPTSSSPGKTGDLWVVYS